MLLLKPILLGVSLAIVVVDALPLNDCSYKSKNVEQGCQELLPRNHYPPHDSYSKKEAIDFVKSIPPDKLEGGFMTKIGTIYTPKGQDSHKGHRLDMQSMVPIDGHPGEYYHNIQVQLNGKRSGKTTVGGLLVTGTWSANRTRKELIHSIMYPSKDKDGKEQFRRQKVKQAPPVPNLPGKKRRKTKPNPNSKRIRKAARKALWKY